MKLLLIFCYSVFLSNYCFAQGTPPKLIELSISNPQPRLNENCNFSLNIEPIKRTILSTVPKQQIAGYTEVSSDRYTVLSKKMDRKGHYEIGPFTFIINGINYFSNKIEYEVIDSLPLSDEGLWIRAVKQSDSTFCVIIEQRIPMDSARMLQYKNQLKNPVQDDHITLFKRMGYDTNKGVKWKSAANQRETTSVTINGEKRRFEFSKYFYFMEITDRSGSIILTANDFVNLHSNYPFVNIKIQ